MQLRVHEEPALESQDDLPPPAEEPTWIGLVAGIVIGAVVLLSGAGACLFAWRRKLGRDAG